MIDIKLLTFITVAKTKNYTKASNILNITQPAVSQHIKALEQHYNVKLFIKSGKSMLLTVEGNLLLTRAQELNRLSIKLENELRNKSSIIKKYNIGATLTIGGYVLPKLIGEYRKLYSNIEIIMRVENTENVMKKLFNGEIDLGVVEGPFDKSSVNHIKFKDDELVLAVSSHHPFAKKPCVSVKDILDDKLILREKGSGTRQFWENKLIENGYNITKYTPYMEIGNITALISLVESNLGCTVISKQAVTESVKKNTIKIVPIEEFQIIREFNFVYVDDINKEFIDHFINFCKEF